jgi:hypothetical protein
MIDIFDIIAFVVFAVLLAAAREVENGIISFLNSQREAQIFAASAKDAALALKLASDNFAAGTIDYTPVFVAEQFLVQQQNANAQAQGDAAVRMITIRIPTRGSAGRRTHPFTSAYRQVSVRISPASAWATRS